MRELKGSLFESGRAKARPCSVLNIFGIIFPSADIVITFLESPR